MRIWRMGSTIGLSLLLARDTTRWEPKWSMCCPTHRVGLPTVGLVPAHMHSIDDKRLMRCMDQAPSTCCPTSRARLPTVGLVPAHMHSIDDPTKPR